MAILRSCCWWNNVAYGSYGTAVYSFLIGGVFTILVVFDVKPFHFFGASLKGHVVTIGSYAQIVTGASLCLTACILVIGVHRNTKRLLLPWMVCMLLFTIVLITGNIHLLIRKFEKNNGGADILVTVLSCVFCLLNLYGGLCVISLYQNLAHYANSCDGRNSSTCENVLPEKKSVSFFKRGNFSNSSIWSNYTPSISAITPLPIRIAMPGMLKHLATESHEDAENPTPLPATDVPSPDHMTDRSEKVVSYQPRQFQTVTSMRPIKC